MQRKSKHFFLIFLATPKKGSFLYRLHYVRQGSTTKLWKGVILTKPFGFDTMNTEAIRKPLMLCPAKQFMTAKPSIHVRSTIHARSAIHVLENRMVLGDNSRKNELKSVDFMN